MRRNRREKPPKLFFKGDKIEVRRRNAAAAVIWCPATFIRSSLRGICVRFDAASGNLEDSRNEYVAAEDVRPAPSQELHRYFKVGESVEGFCTDHNGWRKATVVTILENSKYSVSFEGDGQRTSLAELEQWELRAVREWVDGSWCPPSRLERVLQAESSESRVKSRGLILRLKCGRNLSVMTFNDGMLVEVTSDEEGFRGSWFSAVIVKSLGSNKFMVEYRTLQTANKTEFLKEEVDISCIRHCPPVVKRVLPFEYLEKVDAWYNDGWWEGYIVQVSKGCMYTVHFFHTDEEMVFEHCRLRPHQDWIDGKWCAASKVNLSDVSMKPDKAKLKRKYCRMASEPLFRKGLIVEVKSDEEGYQGSWYTAVIVCALPCDQYLVEYQTLKTEDESELLQEKAFASYIRPFPPKIVRLDRFKMLEEVDAWYNDGWWVGLVAKVLDGLRYSVYFWTTNEELIFEHHSLRPHQDWIGGKWILTFRKDLQLPVKKTLGKCHGEGDGDRVGPNLMNGTKVEVKSDVQGCGVSWYPANIVTSLGSKSYLVEYQTLETDDGTQLHKGQADAICIRPRPPLKTEKQFEPGDIVDVWYNGGWWVGQICEVLKAGCYSVCFNTTEKTLEFQHSELRPHLNWICGQWVSAKRGQHPYL